MLHEVAEFENVVISTGGGAPCFYDNMEFMNRTGKTVFLNVHPDVLFRRLRVAKQQRPILQGKHPFADQYPCTHNRACTKWDVLLQNNS